MRAIIVFYVTNYKAIQKTIRITTIIELITLIAKIIKIEAKAEVIIKIYLSRIIFD